jgi:putative addiction module component (TIGR02574 family)
MDDVNTLANRAMALKPVDRIHLVEAILRSLDEPDAAIEKAWIEEAERRYEAVKNGRMKTRSWDEVKKGLIGGD